MSSSTQINGTVADGFGPVADAFERNFSEHGELGAAFSLYVDGEVKADLWGGVADTQTGETVDRRHAAARLLHDQGSRRDLCRPPGCSRSDLLRRHSRHVLARVRGERQGRHHDRAADEPPGGAAVRHGHPFVRRPDGRHARRRSARRAGADLGARHAARVPRTHLRLVGRRTPAAGRRSHDRAVLRGRGRRSTGSRLLDRPARVGGATRRLPRSGAAAHRSRGVRRDDADRRAGNHGVQRCCS